MLSLSRVASALGALVLIHTFALAQGAPDPAVELARIRAERETAEAERAEAKLRLERIEQRLERLRAREAELQRLELAELRRKLAELEGARSGPESELPRAEPDVDSGPRSYVCKGQTYTYQAKAADTSYTLKYVVTDVSETTVTYDLVILLLGVESRTAGQKWMISTTGPQGPTERVVAAGRAWDCLVTESSTSKTWTTHTFPLLIKVDGPNSTMLLTSIEGERAQASEGRQAAPSPAPAPVTTSGLEHVAKGQTYLYEADASGTKYTMRYVVTDISATSVTYDVTTVILGNESRVTGAIWQLPKSQGDMPAGLPTETIEAGGLRWKCFVTEAHGTKSWTVTTFPGLIKTEGRAQKMTLVSIE